MQIEPKNDRDFGPVPARHPLRDVAAAFVLFRLFDIWKPTPVRQLEALPEGLGIVADDALAGAYTALVLFLAGSFHWY
jgi:phosphatidylglycerophosphatase A